MSFARKKPVLVFVQRRDEIRQRFYLRIGKLLTSHNSILAECTIHDMSSIGARVKLLTDEVIPERFRFFDAVGCYTRIARLAWKDGQMAGMRFLSEPIDLSEQQFLSFGQNWQHKTLAKMCNAPELLLSPGDSGDS